MANRPRLQATEICPPPLARRESAICERTILHIQQVRARVAARISSPASMSAARPAHRRSECPVLFEIMDSAGSAPSRESSDPAAPRLFRDRARPGRRVDELKYAADGRKTSPAGLHCCGIVQRFGCHLSQTAAVQGGCESGSMRPRSGRPPIFRITDATAFGRVADRPGRRESVPGQAERCGVIASVSGAARGGRCRCCRAGS